MTTDRELHAYEQVFVKYNAEASARQKAIFDGIESGTPSSDDDMRWLYDMREWEDDRASAMIDAALAEWGGTLAMPGDDLRCLCGYAGRIHGPSILQVLHRTRTLNPDCYPEMVPSIWGMAEYPGIALHPNQWRELWETAGFTIDHEPAQRPAITQVLWRAAWPGHKRGMSWTDDRDRAVWFLQARGGKSRLYEAEVEPHRLFARIDNAGRRESEWVIDTRGLRITEVKA